MRPYSLKKLKEIVAVYNETKSSVSVATRLDLPHRDMRKILLWLHRHDPANEDTNEETVREFTLKVPKSKVWAQFLYLHDVPPHTAAAFLNWPLERLLSTCGGPEEWAKHGGREPIALHENKIWAKQERRPNDPTEDEIAARKRELHATRGAGVL